MEVSLQMAQQERSPHSIRHVAIFPPARNSPCKLETGAVPATAEFQGGMDDSPNTCAHRGEEEEPERWDGLS
jgi:hypothetical protein